MFENMNVFPKERQQAAKSPLQKALDQLHNTIQTGGTQFANASVTKTFLGMESVSDDILMDTKNTFVAALEDFSSQFNSTDDNFQINGQSGQVESFESALYDLRGEKISGVPAFNVEAAAHAAVAVGAPNDYHQRATKVSPSLEDVSLYQNIISGPAGSMPVVDSVSMESYDTQALNNYAAMSIAFNGGGARQDAFGELFFDTKVCPADQTGHQLEIRPTMIMRDPRHGDSGRPMEFGRRRLLDAVYDDSILASESTALIPFLDAGTNDTYFFEEGDVALPNRTVDGVDIPTGFLRAGPEMDLLSLTAHPGLLDNGVLDFTDSIDPPLNIKTLLVKISDGTDTEYLSFDTTMMQGNQFHTPAEGKGRDQTLQWNLKGLVVRKSKTQLDGTTSTLLGPLGANDWSIGLKGLISGYANLQKGNIQIPKVELSLASITDVAGESVSTTGGAGKTFADALTTIEVVGWVPEGTRSNLNLRQRGLILTYETSRFRFAPPLQAPLSVVIPTSKTGADAVELEALTSAARVRNSNNAVIALFNYADMLERYTNNAGEIGYLQGPGAQVLRPCYIEREVDVDARITTISSYTRELDVNAILINEIRDVAHELLYKSGYQAALEHASLGSNVKPVLCIGTDPRTQRYLTIKGDPRTSGIAMDSQIATTINRRLRSSANDEGFIFLTFKRPGVAAQGIDPLSFGFHSWTPELVSVNPISRNGQTSRELTVQPRSMHFPIMPVMAKLKIVNLIKAATSQ